jgi:hypothetical protein
MAKPGQAVVLVNQDVEGVIDNSPEPRSIERFPSEEVCIVR